MALAITQVYARTPFRVRVVFSGGSPAGQPASAFALTRQDGGPNEIVISSLFPFDTASLELSASSRLLAGIIYVLTWSGQAIPFSYAAPLAQRQDAAPTRDDDPEAEAFGVDVAWLFSEPTAGGDCPQRRGRACNEYDLPRRAVLKRGELVHLPNAGGNLLDSINGPNDVGTALEQAAAVEADRRNDERLTDVEADVSTDTEGRTLLNGRVVPFATGLPIEVRNT
jgi:hypothetical protein